MRLLGRVRSFSNAVSEVDCDTCAERERNDTAMTLGTESHVLRQHQRQLALFEPLDEQPATLRSAIAFLFASPSLALLLFGGFYRNCGAFVWCVFCDFVLLRLCL